MNEEKAQQFHLMAEGVALALTDEVEGIAAIVIVFPSEEELENLGGDIPTGMVSTASEDYTNMMIASYMPAPPEEESPIWTPDQKVTH